MPHLDCRAVTILIVALQVAPDWMRWAIPPVWVELYGRRIEDARLPEAAIKREAYAVQVGTDGFTLLDRVEDPGAPETIRTLSIMATLQRVWARHFERSIEGQGGPGGIVGFRTLRARGPGESP